MEFLPGGGLVCAGIFGADHKQRADHQHDADGQAQQARGPHAHQDARDEVGDAGHHRAGDGVRQLCGHMVYVVALGARGGHDGGVGDGGAVVAADRARHAGGDADDGHGVVHGEDVLHDGNQDAEGAPGGAGGEGQQAADGEHDQRQDHLEAAGGGPDEVPDEELRAQGVRHVLQAPGEGEDHDGGDHGLEALGR